jgi:hypothetical protein
VRPSFKIKNWRENINTSLKFKNLFRVTF